MHVAVAEIVAEDEDDTWACGFLDSAQLEATEHEREEGDDRKRRAMRWEGFIEEGWIEPKE